MNLLALDLGTNLGWAYHIPGQPDTAGTLVLATRKEITQAKRLRLDRRCDPRFIRLVLFLDKLVDQVQPDWVMFEDVEFIKSRQQAHLWATWRAAVWALAVRRNVQIDCLATGKLKAFATGSGAADKERMCRALTLDPRYTLDKSGVRDTLRNELLDDNSVDALHLLNWAKKTFK